MKISKYIGLGVCVVLASSCRNNPVPEKPNIIYILADDLGYGDLGCYGQTKTHTPHIDRLAAEGLHFTQHYAGCTVSAPSHSSLATGLHTGHPPIRGNKEHRPEGQYPQPGDTYTINFVTSHLQPDGKILVGVDHEHESGGWAFNQFWFSCHIISNLYLMEFLEIFPEYAEKNKYQF